MEVTYLTGRQAAEAINVSKKTLLKYLREGLFPGAFRLPATATHPGEWRIPQSDIDKFSEPQKREKR